ncbi:MAG: hypothetical protein PHW01_00245 [Patescibacteria group bacterium]|nr:hypothetical protein [Patescibacteria group bacterium]
MKHFIFLTHEGETKTPSEEDVENMQVLGVNSGDDAKSAFENFVQETKYFKNKGYSDVIAMELKSEKQHYFSLKTESSDINNHGA